MQNLVLINKFGLLGNVRILGLCYLDNDMVEFKILRTVRRCIRSLQLWTSGEKVLTFSRISLIKYPKIKPSMEERPKKADSRITSSSQVFHPNILIIDNGSLRLYFTLY